MRLLLLIVPLSLAACSRGSLEVAERDSDGIVDTEVAGDTDVADTDDSGAPDTDLPETWPKACSELYDPDTLQTFSLDFTQEAWSDVQADCQAGAQTYRPVTFGWNGETVEAMARLKGNWSWSCDKLQFVVSFNEIDSDGRFHGQRKLVLDAPWYDHTLLHERIAFPLFREAGLPYSCANNARVEINGEYYGLYANLERIDREYLERNFEEPDGNLYQGGSELKTNEDVNDTSRLLALQAATTADEYAALADLDQGVAEWAMEALIPAMDNYWAGVEINYYLYDHPSRGFVWLPYDLDITFGDPAYPGYGKLYADADKVDPITYEHGGWLKEPLVQRVLADPAWCERFVEELRNARAVYDPEEMVARIDAWDAQIRPSLVEDRRRPYTVAEHDAAIADLRAFLPARAAFVDGWLAEGGHCPARW